MQNNKASLAINAAVTAKDLYGDALAQIDAMQKTSFPRDIVTKTDFRIERALREMLELDAPVISEESFRIGADVFSSNGDVWLIDPIDGTVNYCFGLPLYCTSVGLIRNGEFLTGAVAIPQGNHLFYTNPYGTAYRNTLPLRMATAGKLNSALVCLNLPNQETRAPFAGELFALLNNSSRGCLRLGSASVSLCYLAAAHLHAVVGVANRLWDGAAGFAIATASGAKLVHTLNPITMEISYVVGIPDIVDELLSIFDKQGLRIMNNDTVTELAHEGQ